MIQAIQPANYAQNSNKTSVASQHSQRGGFSVPETLLPLNDRNYSLFNQDKVNFFVSQGQGAFPYIQKTLNDSQDEQEIVETLYIVNRLADNKTKDLYKLYPFMAKFNDTDSPNIQTYLAGAYRKMLVPDAFGPLCTMLIRNSNKQPDKNALFNPNEEIGGAILEYIKKWSNQFDFKKEVIDNANQDDDCTYKLNYVA